LPLFLPPLFYALRTIHSLRLLDSFSPVGLPFHSCVWLRRPAYPFKPFSFWKLDVSSHEVHFFRFYFLAFAPVCFFCKPQETIPFFFFFCDKASFSGGVPSPWRFPASTHRDVTDISARGDVLKQRLFHISLFFFLPSKDMLFVPSESYRGVHRPLELFYEFPFTFSGFSAHFRSD